MIVFEDIFYRVWGCFDLFIDGELNMEELKIVLFKFRPCAKLQNEKDIIKFVENLDLFFTKLRFDKDYDKYYDDIKKHFETFLCLNRLYLIRYLYDPKVKSMSENSIFMINEKYLSLVSKLKYNFKFENIYDNLYFNLSFNQNGLLNLNIDHKVFPLKTLTSKNILSDTWVFLIHFSFPDENELIHEINPDLLKFLFPLSHINQIVSNLNSQDVGIISKEIQNQLNALESTKYPEYRICIFSESITESACVENIRYFLEMLISHKFCIFIPISYLNSNLEINLMIIENYKKYIFNWKNEELVLFPFGISFVSPTEELCEYLRLSKENFSTNHNGQIDEIIKNTLHIFGSNISIINESNKEIIFSKYYFENSLINYQNGDNLFISSTIIAFQELSKHKRDLNDYISTLPL